MQKENLQVQYVQLSELQTSTYNPRKWSKESLSQLKESIKRFGTVEALLVNSAANRKNIVIGGHMRIAALKELGKLEAPVVYLSIPDESKEKELNLRLNKNRGEFDLELLSAFDESLLSDIGFASEELDDIFASEEKAEVFDLEKELNKLNITEVKVQKGDVYQLGNHRLMCGDSTIEKDFLRLMNNEKADLCLTDPPYILDYLKGKKKGQDKDGFGLKRDRRYMETDSLPDNFTELWMTNISKIAKENFSIICYENWKNIRTIWSEMEKFWKVKNMIVWHLPNRTQGFAAKYKFFNKHDIAMVGTSGSTAINTAEEEALLQEEYETALFATSGKPHWENYEKGKKICPTDFIEYKASDEKSSGQGIIFGTKPIEILIPYIKVLTKRGGLVVEPYGGSGSTLIACEKMARMCYAMEKVPTYTEVIIKRWEKLTGSKAVKISSDENYAKNHQVVKD